MSRFLKKKKNVFQSNIIRAYTNIVVIRAQSSPIRRSNGLRTLSSQDSRSRAESNIELPRSTALPPGSFAAESIHLPRALRFRFRCLLNDCVRPLPKRGLTPFEYFSCNTPKDVFFIAFRIDGSVVSFPLRLLPISFLFSIWVIQRTIQFSSRKRYTAVSHYYVIVRVSQPSTIDTLGFEQIQYVLSISIFFFCSIHSRGLFAPFIP